MWVRISSQQPLDVVCAVAQPSSSRASARGGSRWLLSRVTVVGRGALAPGAPSAPAAGLDGLWGCSLAVLSPWAGGAGSAPVPASAPACPWSPRDGRVSLVPLLSPCQVAQGARDTRILLLPSSGILWDVQAQPCLSLTLEKEKQALPQHKEGKVEMNPGLQEPQLGQSPREVLAPSPCSAAASKRLETGAKSG